MQPLVTIITATDNIIASGKEEFFRNCVNTVKMQSYSNIEHIIIDNFSSDGSRFLFEDIGLTLFSEPYTEIYNAYNLGVQHAKGKYILFLKYDDSLFYSDAIRAAVDFMEKKDAEFYLSPYRVNGRFINVSDNLNNVFKSDALGYQGIIYKKSLLEKYPFDESYKIAADYKQIMQLFLDKVPFAVSVYSFLDFGQHYKGITQVDFREQERTKARKEVLSQIYNFSEEDWVYYLQTNEYPQELEEKLEDCLASNDLYKEGLKLLNVDLYKVSEISLKELIKNYENEQNKNVIEKFLYDFRFLLYYIDKFLVKNLNESDKNIFVQFLLKRYANIDTTDLMECTLLNFSFSEVFNLYQSRRVSEEPISISVNDKIIKFIDSEKSFYERLSKQGKFYMYHECVHSLKLQEYLLNGFEPKNGQGIINCKDSIGFLELLFKLSCPQSPIYTLEKQYSRCNMLKKNMELNGYSDVKVFNYFVLDEIDFKTVTIDAFVKVNKIDDIGTIVVSLDEAEKMLYGAINTIKTQKPILIIPISYELNRSLPILRFIEMLNIPYEYGIKWVDKRLIGNSMTLFVKFK